jgi:heme/copper-type cytochrome/quinol oxidase subunit 2
MMRTNRESKPMLIALALVAALPCTRALLRGPIEEVLAQGLGGLTIGHGTLIRCPGVAVLHTDQGSLARVINVTASEFKFIPRQIMLKKGLPVTLRLTSIDHTPCFLLRALKIDTDISSGTTMEVTMTPQVSRTFEAIGDHYGGARHGYVKMTVMVQ